MSIFLKKENQMSYLNIEILTQFCEDITGFEDYEDLADRYGDGLLIEAIENQNFDAENMVSYLMKYSSEKPIFSEKMSEILKIHSEINKAIELIGEATSILTDYNHRFDNSASAAIDAFFENTTHHPSRMFIELLENSIR